MAQVETGTLGFKPSMGTSSGTAPTTIPFAGTRPNMSAKPPLQSFKSGHLNLDTFSPVNQNGSFEFDQVLKSGKVNRRVKSKGAWKATWKPIYLVLRPNLLSMYKCDDETGIRASITLSDVTAVAPVKKGNMANVFGVFSLSKNHHLQGNSDADTADWIERIRQEARVDIHEEVVIPSPTARTIEGNGNYYETTDLSGEDDGDRPSSSEILSRPLPGQNGPNSRRSTYQQQPSAIHEYSGNEMTTSCSDFSDVPRGSTGRSRNERLSQTTMATGPRPSTTRNTSQVGGFDANTDNERVVCQGWLYHLKSKGGVKQWKKRWTVLRPKSLSFYKNEQEYSAVKIISMSSVINAGEIDPVSKSKVYCLQLNMEENKTYKFCAPNEDSLVKWLGSFKSVFERRLKACKKAGDSVVR